MDYKTAILELYFTMHRQSTWNDYIPWMKKYSNILHSLKLDIAKVREVDSLNECIRFMVYLYKLIGYTRDIYFGKGEQDLTCLMLYL